ncbi:hypothetical protein WMF45_35615 [Sorangium sp. So ce448]|uniref:hypothetical protein n=1 Tax=Sorangium sp. So ce448 TaxID=3133314 RepID=UPI003F5E884B
MSANDFERRVRAVEWYRYEHDCCSAFIPDVIIGLISGDDVRRQESCDRLEDCLLPQGVLVEASYHAIPFLVELIREGMAPGCVYELLVLMTIAAQSDAYDEGIRVNGNLRSLTESSRGRIADGLGSYCRDLQNRNLSKDRRLAALSIVCRLRERRDEWLPLIRRVYDAEQDPEMRREMLYWLSDVEQEGKGTA